MRIRELIRALEALATEYGDLPVWAFNSMEEIGPADATFFPGAEHEPDHVRIVGHVDDD